MGGAPAFTRGAAGALAAVMCLALAVRLLDLGQELLWGDEAFTWWWTRQPLAGQWGSNAALEPDPPLFYTIAWLSTELLGNDERALRLPSALLGTLGVGAVFLVGRTAGGTRTGLLAALLTAIAAPHVYYSQEARTYALLSLLGTLAVWGVVAPRHSLTLSDAQRYPALRSTSQPPSLLSTRTIPPPCCRLWRTWSRWAGG